ncbi:hypothetical protein PVK06_002541 [Gossypium arboreum]|uniref:Uncharacterized protein n=1 Tax=Gossypium arboreum TaxID=29729 RepID=A0ABR0R4X3_GOSAR|nr:hypothetical protein PVK06_002541 [Gossypium arboreum]
MAQCMRPRTGTSTINVVVNSEDDSNSGRLEIHHKRRANHAETSAMMITASFSTSSQTTVRESSPILACGNSPPPSICPLSVPPLIELPLGNRSDLALSHKNLNREELQDIMGKWRASMFNSSLQVLFIEAYVISVGLEERIGRIKAIQRKLEVNLKEVGAEQVNYDKLVSEVTVLYAEWKKVSKEHKVVVSQTNEDHEDETTVLKRKQEEAFEGFKKNTLNMLSAITVKLKSNILLHTQVIVRLFDVRKVDFDALVEVEMDQLGFDVHYPSRAVLDEFLSKWKNSERFYLEGSLEPTIFPIDDDTIDTPAANNVDVVKEEGRGEVGREEDEGREKEVPVESFALVNYIGVYGSSSASLSMILESFALANCVGGCNSLLTSLSMADESFALVNSVEGCSSSPVSLSMIVGALFLLTVLEAVPLHLRALI